MKRIKNILICIALILLIPYATVKAVTTDQEGPILKNISFVDGNNLEYHNGDKVYINLDAYDDVTGVDKIYLMTNVPMSVDETHMHESMEVYYDNEKPYVIIPDSYYNGDFIIEEVILNDKANNDSTYYYKDTPKIDMTFKVIEGKDYVPKTYNDPEFVSLSIDKTTVKYGEYLSLELKLNNVSGGYVSVVFSPIKGEYAKSFTLYYDDLTQTYKSTSLIEDGSGEYKLYYVVTQFGNYNYFHPKSYSFMCDKDPKANCELDEYNLKIESTSGYKKVEDLSYITLNNIKLQKNSYAIPSIFDVEIQLVSTDGYPETISASFKNGEHYLTSTLFNQSNGIYKGQINADQYSEVGNYELYFISVQTDNRNHIFANSFKYADFDLNISASFILYSKYNVDVMTGTNAENIYSTIENSKEDAIIYIDAIQNTIIPKKVFELIKGTNKEIHIESNGIEWIFNGKDISNPKEIDTKIDYIYDYDYKKIDTTKYTDRSIVLDFKDNGELPGKCTIRLKLDYALKDYLGTSIYVYYYNEDGTKVLEAISLEKIIESDEGFFEFQINHNSTYILSSKKASSTYVNYDSPKTISQDKYMYVYLSIGALFVALITTSIILIAKKLKKNKIIKNSY